MVIWTSQALIGWLKAASKWNMPDLMVTLETSQCPIGWLKVVIQENMADMVMTLETSQWSTE